MGPSLPQRVQVTVTICNETVASSPPPLLSSAAIGAQPLYALPSHWPPTVGSLTGGGVFGDGLRDGGGEGISQVGGIQILLVKSLRDKSLPVYDVFYDAIDPNGHVISLSLARMNRLFQGSLTGGGVFGDGLCDGGGEGISQVGGVTGQELPPPLRPAPQPHPPRH
jgi:hypothetical protein